MLDHKGISDLWTRSAPPHFSDLMPDLKQSAWQCHLSEKKKKKVEVKQDVTVKKHLLILKNWVLLGFSRL